jgi:hypothetical protein
MAAPAAKLSANAASLARRGVAVRRRAILMVAEGDSRLASMRFGE